MRLKRYLSAVRSVFALTACKFARGRNQCSLSPPAPGFATHHPGGMADNSPTFQRWELDRNWVQVPKGRLKRRRWSALPSGLVARRTVVPNVETLGYFRKSLRDRE